MKRNEKRETVASTADSWLPVHATGMLPASSRTCSGAATCNVREHMASANTADHKRQTGGNHNRNRKPHAACRLHNFAYAQFPFRLPGPSDIEITANKTTVPIAAGIIALMHHASWRLSFVFVFVFVFVLCDCDL